MIFIPVFFIFTLLSVTVFAVTAVAEKLLVVFNAVFVVVILYSRLYSLLGKYRTVYLVCRKTVKRLNNGFV